MQSRNGASVHALSDHRLDRISSQLQLAIKYACNADRSQADTEHRVCNAGNQLMPCQRPICWDAAPAQALSLHVTPAFFGPGCNKVAAFLERTTSCSRWSQQHERANACNACATLNESITEYPLRHLQLSHCYWLTEGLPDAARHMPLIIHSYRLQFTIPQILQGQAASFYWCCAGMYFSGSRPRGAMSANLRSHALKTSCLVMKWRSLAISLEIMGMDIWVSAGGQAWSG